jgi:hypothetical protein
MKEEGEVYGENEDDEDPTDDALRLIDRIFSLSLRCADRVSGKTVGETFFVENPHGFDSNQFRLAYNGLFSVPLSRLPTSKGAQASSTFHPEND